MMTTPVDFQAWHEIHSLIHRYARAVDRIDAELGYSIFHPDATADYDDFYKGTARGAIDAICETHRGLLAHSHQITTVNIAIDGERAGSEACHFATIRAQVDGKLVHSTFLGRYVDRWSRRDGRWAIDHRQVLRDLDETREIIPVTSESAPRDPTCPSYAALAIGGGQ
jgi:hypothetical protein